MPDAWRLALGTFTRVPVPAPRRIDAGVAGAAMALAPVVAAALALVIGLAVQALHTWRGGAISGPVLSTLAFCGLAYATRALHLDGLADTADALGSGKPAQQALDVARRSDIGPFGVVTLVLVLMLDVFSYGSLIDHGWAVPALVIAVGSSRLLMVLACARGVPAARTDGLGATVAGSVPRVIAAAVIVAWLLACALIFGWFAPQLLVAAVAGTLAALGAGALLLAVCVRRLGGITGDVLGATIEVGLASGLVILVALAP